MGLQGSHERLKGVPWGPKGIQGSTWRTRVSGGVVGHMKVSWAFQGDSKGSLEFFKEIKGFQESSWKAGNTRRSQERFMESQGLLRSSQGLSHVLGSLRGVLRVCLEVSGAFLGISGI